MTNAEMRLIEEASTSSGLLDNIDTRLKELLEGQPTLWDRFAMAALTGMLASDRVQTDLLAWGTAQDQRLAVVVYEMADACMAARGGAL